MNTLNTDFQNFDRLATQGYSFNIKSYLNTGLEIFKQDIPKFVGHFALYLLLQFVAGALLGDAGEAIISVLSGVWMAGYYIVAKKIQCQETYEYKNFFDGFQMFLPLFLVGLVGGLLTILGFVLLIVPGVYLGVGYMFASLFVVFYGLEFWDALETSRKVITKNWFQVFLFVLALVGINILGLLALGVGLLATIPISILAVYAAFEDVTSQA